MSLLMQVGRQSGPTCKNHVLLQGPCCTNDCEFRTHDKCRDDNGCRGESFCDGTGPHCPVSDLKPNKTVCHEEFVCYKGVSARPLG